jgi:hypothetical protein
VKVDGHIMWCSRARRLGVLCLDKVLYM